MNQKTPSLSRCIVIRKWCTEVLARHQLHDRCKVKFLHHMKKSTERGKFPIFNAYFCRVMDDFTCLELQYEVK